MTRSDDERKGQLVHVDQTPYAAELRVSRHLPPNEAERLLQGRYQIVNVWRPIQSPTFDTPLVVSIALYEKGLR